MRKKSALFTFVLILSAFGFLSAEGKFIPDNQLVVNGNIYVSTRDEGMFVSENGGRSWISVSSGLPLKHVYPFDRVEYRPVTSFYVDPLDNNRIAVSEPSGIFVSKDGGGSWESIPLGGAVKRTNYITSVAFSPSGDGSLVVGTSFNGIFMTSDRGKTWKKTVFKDNPLYMGAGFYEEITSLAFDPAEKSLYILCGLDDSLYVSRNKGIIEKISLPELKASRMKSVYFYSGVLSVYTDKNVLSLRDGAWSSGPLPVDIPQGASDSSRSARIASAEGKKGIYVNSFHASGARLDKLITLIKARGFNSLVVDMKDDEGFVTYDTSLQLPETMGAVRIRFKIGELVAAAHDNGLYLIGRIVTFKDPMLYRYKDYSYAVWDAGNKKPWGNMVVRNGEKVQTEFWTDPFSPEVWDYNTSIAEELQNAGVDEIQFDYIRFPSDGDLSSMTFRFRKKGMTRTDALESFLRRVRERISIPVSTDLYGFNSWYRMGNWIGQNIGLFSGYVDVISPMFYPSHFPGSFRHDDNYLRWAYMLYHRGTARAKRITGDSVVIRPYVQAFLMGHELSMEKDEYTSYLDEEIKGAEDGGASGFTLWNNSNRYYMLGD